MNAIRHTPADGVVLVEGRAIGDTVELPVTDGCGGIDPRGPLLGLRGRLARRPLPGRRDPTPGPGWAWPSSEELVEAHRGTVAVTNHGTGCRFVVRLPAQ